MTPRATERRLERIARRCGVLGSERCRPAAGQTRCRRAPRSMSRTDAHGPRAARSVTPSQTFVSSGGRGVDYCRPLIHYRGPDAASRGETALVRELAGAEASAPRRGAGRGGYSSSVSALEWRGAAYYRASKRPSVRPCAAVASGSLVEDSSTTPPTSARSPKTGFPTPHNQAVRMSLTAARLTAITERTPVPARTVKWWSSLRWTRTSPWVRSSGHEAPPCARCCCRWPIDSRRATRES